MFMFLMTTVSCLYSFVVPIMGVLIKLGKWTLIFNPEFYSNKLVRIYKLSIHMYILLV